MPLRPLHAALPLALLAAPLLANDAGGGAGDAASGDRYAGAVARTVTALIEYSTWPSRPNPLTLCVAGAVSHAGQIEELRLSDGRKAVRRNVAPSAVALGECEVLYLGNMGQPAMRQLVAAVRGKGVLTIAEADPDCRSEAMVCLIYLRAGLSFQLNIDAVARSGLRLDPRVLRMARGGS